MKLTKKQKIGIGVLGLAAAAFAMDRLVFSGESEGSESAHVAAAAAAPRRTNKAEHGDGAERQQQLAAAALLARRLDQVVMAEGLSPGKSSDGFRPPAE